MNIGTSHFLDKASAMRYYRPYGATKRLVERKLREGEIHLGPPKCAADETCYLNPAEGRYFKRVKQ